MLSASAWRTRASSRTVMVLAPLTQSVTAYRGNGSDAACGAMALNRTVRLELPHSTLSFLRSKLLRCPKVFRWSRVPVSEFPESLLIVQFISRARSTRQPLWCKAVRVRLALAPFNLLIRQEHESSPPAAPKATRLSLREQGPTRCC